MSMAFTFYTIMLNSGKKISFYEDGRKVPEVGYIGVKASGCISSNEITILIPYLNRG